MQMQQTINNTNLDDFWAFVQERHRIYWRRFIKKKVWPWTKNKTLRDYFFTNVYRELDRGSLYLTQVIFPQYQDDDRNTLFAILVYRLFNHIPTWQFIGQPMLGYWKWKNEAGDLKKWRAKGHQVFTSAFTVTGNRFGGFPDKIDNICWLIDWLQTYLITDHKWRDIWTAPNMEDAFNEIKAMKGFGAFLAYEIVIDINYAKGEDGWGENSFVNPGPGAKRGLNHIFPDMQGKDYIRGIKWLRKQQPCIPHGGPLSLRNVEHSLCEYQKYVKRRDGKKGGRARHFEASHKPLPK